MSSEPDKNTATNATFYASPERADEVVIAQELKTVLKNPVTTGLLHSVTGLLAVLNEQRQILAVNDLFLKTLHIDDPEATLGLRPGEVLHCRYAHMKPAGCGTTEYCSTCGAAIALVSSFGLDEPVERTCIISRQGTDFEDLVFTVRSQPLSIDGKRFLLLFLQDATRQQQQAALERTFFHDINNMLNSLVGASDLLVDECPSEMAKMIQASALRLIKEVAIQRFLTRGNSARYTPELTKLNANTLIEEVCSLHRHHSAAKEVRIFSVIDDPEYCITSDRSLLLRILSNMLLNACEASEAGHDIKVSARRDDNGYTFSVWNRKKIPDNVARRIFQRNFSSKEQQGRGLGTFSMKLFGEKILGGKVWFTTSDEGTQFNFRLPLK
jgi:signal transduction histidine kinase